MLVAFLSPETTLTLRNLASELQEVVDWYRVGLNLGIKSYQLEEIRINRMGDAMHCKLNMLDLWLRGDVDASWSKLVGALAESNHSFIADRIQEKYLGIKVKPSKLLSVCSVEPLHSNPSSEDTPPYIAYFKCLEQSRTHLLNVNKPLKTKDTSLIKILISFDLYMQNRGTLPCYGKV